MPDGGVPDKDLRFLHRKYGVKSNRIAPLGEGATVDATSILLGSHSMKWLQVVMQSHFRRAHEDHLLNRLTVLDSVRAKAVQSLEHRVAQLEAALRARQLWRLNDLKATIGRLAKRYEISETDALELCGLLDRLHGLVRDHGIECIPDPQVDRNVDATLDLIWFDRTKGASLGVTVTAPGDTDGRIWIHYLDRDVSEHVFDPSDAVILRLLRKLAGV